MQQSKWNESAEKHVCNEQTSSNMSMNFHLKRFHISRDTSKIVLHVIKQWLILHSAHSNLESLMLSTNAGMTGSVDWIYVGKFFWVGRIHWLPNQCYSWVRNCPPCRLGSRAFVAMSSSPNWSSVQFSSCAVNDSYLLLLIFHHPLTLSL